MKKPSFHAFSALLIFLLIAASALCACTQTPPAPPPETPPLSSPQETVGEGAKTFSFTAVDADGAVKSFLVKTDKNTVGEALLDAGLIEGDTGAYGLYVKKVCGTLAEFETTGTYWAFYVNGSYALNGVDSTEIDESAEYSFRAEQG